MHPVILNGQLFRRLLHARFADGVAGLQSHWDASGGPNRATLYRWIGSALPRSPDDLLRLCALLDVDPFCLLVPGGGNAIAAASALIHAYQNDHWERVPALSFLRQFAGRQSEWPPSALATEHYRRNWSVIDFTHSASLGHSYYARLELRPTPDRGLLPTTYHFAFRQQHFFGSKWLHYGYVVDHASKVSLVHINGHIQDYDRSANQSRAIVETFFGPISTTFRVASLHSFDLRILTPTETANAPAVRFP